MPLFSGYTQTKDTTCTIDSTRLDAAKLQVYHQSSSQLHSKKILDFKVLDGYLGCVQAGHG